MRNRCKSILFFFFFKSWPSRLHFLGRFHFGGPGLGESHLKWPVLDVTGTGSPAESSSSDVPKELRRGRGRGRATRPCLASSSRSPDGNTGSVCEAETPGRARRRFAFRAEVSGGETRWVPGDSRLRTPGCPTVGDLSLDVSCLGKRAGAWTALPRAASPPLA